VSSQSRFDYLVALGPEVAVEKITRALTNIRISRTARAAGDLGSAEGALNVADRELLEVLGIDEEDHEPEPQREDEPDSIDTLGLRGLVIP
jgi:hypothetical protein